MTSYRRQKSACRAGYRLRPLLCSALGLLGLPRRPCARASNATHPCMVSNPATAAATIEQHPRRRPSEITLSHSASTVVLICEDLIIVRTAEKGYDVPKHKFKTSGHKSATRTTCQVTKAKPNSTLDPSDGIIYLIAVALGKSRVYIV